MKIIMSYKQVGLFRKIMKNYPRYELMTELMLKTGIAYEEISRLKKNDFWYDASQIVIRHDTQIKIVIIDYGLRDRLTAYISDRESNTHYIFRSDSGKKIQISDFQKHLSIVSKMMGIENITSRDLQEIYKNHRYYKKREKVFKL